MEEIYTSRFIEDTAYFKSNLSSIDSSSDNILDKDPNQHSQQALDVPAISFPSFVYSFLSRKYRHKKLIEQVIFDSK